MRKFLSLVLALVMMMSLVTINAGAKEFTDGDDITYREAVDVISTIKVVDGYADGDFKPGNNLSRGAAAKIICNMILGPTTAAELHADTAPYRDVPVTSEFAGYIAYCQKEGIISGYADGSFRPAGTLTGYAFMKMLLGALGYDAEIEGYTGPNWSINVAKKAIGLGLNNSLEKTFNGVDYVTREEAALYAFNTLKADLVEYSSKITANVNGAEVTVGNSNAEPQKWESQQTRSDNIYRDSIVQFAEQYFNKLVLTEDMDVFGRPDREWRYDGEDIGAYINMDLFKQEYTTKVTGRDLYDLLGSKVVDLDDGYHFEIHVDGIETVTENKTDLGSAYFTQGNLIRSNTEKIGATGNGVLTQVFVNNDKDVETVWISVINTYLAKATADYNEKKDEADYEVWSLWNKGTATDMVLVKDTADSSAKTQKTTITVSGEDFDIENVKENDIVLVHVADGAIQEILDPEVIDDAEITSFKKDNWVKADEQYDYATTTMYDDEVLDEYDLSNMKDTTYRIFLDEYGYAIGVEIVEDAAKYVFLTGIDGNTSNLRNKTADGNLIFTDGTMKTAKINMEKSKALNTTFDIDVVGSKPYTEFVPAALWNTWCTYTVSSDDVYTLTQVANTDDQMQSNDSGEAYPATAKRTTDKVGQGRNVDLVTGETDYTAIIDKKHISLDGLNSFDGSVNSTLYRKVYGNDDSVYINVGVNKVSNATKVNPYEAAAGTYAVIIDDVDSVSTGVQSVSLKAYDYSKVRTLDGTKFSDNVTNSDEFYSYGAYTLFDKDGFVIAAVVVGEDDGVSSKYAYTFSNGVDKESWSKADQKWTWTKDVIIDGEEVTLTEVGDSLSELKGTTKNNWYEVKFKADETVKSVTKIETTDDANHGDYVFCKDPETLNHPAGDAAGRGKYPKFIGKIELVEGAQEDNTSGKVVLFEDMWSVSGNGQADNHEGNALTYTLNTAGTSLQVQNDTTGEVKGFAVSGNAKTVLVQDKRVINKDGNPISEMDSIEYFDGGRSGLERAVKKLNLNNKKTDEWFRGYVSAVFENGVAQTVIIYEKLPNDVNWGGDETPSSINVTINNGVISVMPKTPVGQRATDEKLLAIRNKLLQEGYSDINIARDNSGVVTGVTATKDNITTSFGTVGVNALVVASIEVTGTPAAQYAGMEFNPAGLTITATYTDGSTGNVPLADATYAGDNSGGGPLNTSDAVITVTYEGYTDTVNITSPSARTVTAIAASVTGKPKITKDYGAAIAGSDVDTLSIEVTYDVGPSATIPGSTAGVTITETVGAKGDATITVNYGGETDTVTVEFEPTMTLSVNVSGGAQTYTIDAGGPTLSGLKQGESVTVTFTATADGAETNTNVAVSSTNSIASGNGSVTGTGDASSKATVSATISIGAVTAATDTATIALSA